jgi:hypothetical protein
MAGRRLPKVIRIPEPSDFIGLAGWRLGGGDLAGFTARLRAAHRVRRMTKWDERRVQRRR